MAASEALWCVFVEVEQEDQRVVMWVVTRYE